MADKEPTIGAGTSLYIGPQQKKRKFSKGILALIILVGIGFGIIMFLWTFQLSGIWSSGPITGIAKSLGSLGSSVSSIFDIISNPSLALQYGLAPPSEREIDTTKAIPSVAFTVTARAVPGTGCLDTSSFQIIAKVKNEGNIYLRDMKVSIEEDIVHQTLESELTPCGQITGLEECATSSIDVPMGSSVTVTCGNIKVPEIGAPEETATVSQDCYIDVNAEAAYKTSSRLSLQFIDEDYATLQFEQGKLTAKEVPSVISRGPIELAMGGVEQPVWENTRSFTVVTSIKDAGAGKVGEYGPVWLYVPERLLGEDKQCGGERSKYTDTEKSQVLELIGAIEKKNFSLTNLPTQEDWETAREAMQGDIETVVITLQRVFSQAGKIMYSNIRKIITILRTGDYNEFTKQPATPGIEEQDFVCYASCTCKEDDFESGAGGLFGNLYSPNACSLFKKYKSGAGFGTFRGLTYDNECDAMTKIGYRVCFYRRNPAKPRSKVSMITSACQLDVPGLNDYGDTQSLRETYLVRGEIVYSYITQGETVLHAEDCTIPTKGI